MQALDSKTITQLENRSSNYSSTRIVVTAIKCYAFEKSKTLKYHQFTTGFFSRRPPWDVHTYHKPMGILSASND